MSNLAKLAKLSKRLKTSKAVTHDEQAGRSSPEGDQEADDEVPAATAKVTPPAAEAQHAPTQSVRHEASPVAAAAVAPGVAPQVTVNIDLAPVRDALGGIRDQLRELREEVKRTREKGMRVEFGEEANEQLDQALRHMSASSKASRELTEKLVTSLPETRWFNDLVELFRIIGENLSVGGGGGGIAPEDFAVMKEQLDMQQTQLKAILNLLQRR